MFAMIKDFDTDVLPSLESQMARLALEAGVINNVIETFKNTVPALTAGLLEKYKSLVVGEDLQSHVQQVKLEFGKLKVKLPHTSFVQAGENLVSVPEGFRGDLLSYVETLSNMAVDVFQEANKTLGEYNFALSAFITNKESKISLKDHTDVFVRVKERREKFTDSNLPKLKLKDVVGRLGDLEQLVHGVDKLNVQRKSQNIKDVSAAVKKSLDMLNLIVADTKDNGMSQISGNAALNISTGAYEIGKFVEFIAIYRFRVEQLVSCVEKLMVDLETNI
jgi:hypothetical protein